MPYEILTQLLADDPAVGALSDLARTPRPVLVDAETTLAALAERLGAGERDEHAVAALAEVADGIEGVREQLAVRPDPAEAAAALMARIAPPAEVEPAQTAATVRRPTAAAMTAHRPTTMTPQARSGAVRAAVTVAGREVADLPEAATLIASSPRWANTSPGRHTLVSARWQLPEARTLTGMDAAANTAKLDAATAPTALVASGGICAPVAVDYSVPTFGDASRPVRDALPRFGADRGGVRFVAPPSMSNAAGGVGIWTEAVDAAVTYTGGTPSSSKDLLVISCGAEQQVFVDAITARARIGNMQGRFAPEEVAAWLQQMSAYQARIAETNLLTKISAASTAVSASQLLGATRDLLATVDQAASAYR